MPISARLPQPEPHAFAQRLTERLVDSLVGESRTERRRRRLDAAFRLLPRDLAFDLLRHAASPALMDYAGANILLRQSSPQAVKRLHSVAKEPLTVRWVEEFRAGDVFYDVGANVGAYSLIAAIAHGGSVHTFAFEPAVPSYYDLCLNVVLNECDEWITPLPLAVWSRTMLIPFAHFSLEPGSVKHTYSFEAERGGLERLFCQRQPAIALDDVVRLFDLPPPAHIKIDTEGGEAGVLQGARRMLAGETLRSVLVEVDEEESLRPVEQLLEPHAFVLSEQGARKAGALWRLYRRDARPSGARRA